MVLETAVEPNQDQQLSPAEDDEPMPASSTTGDIFFDKVHQLVEKFATNRFGQFVIERVDRLLKTVEDTAKWSLPQEKTESKLERPLPWILFLILIIALRQVRIAVSLGALMIGNGPVTPHDMVYFIQTRRRKLRSIRIHGLRVITQRKLEHIALRSGSQDSGFMVKLGKLLTIAICRPGYHSEPARRVPVQREQEDSQQNQHYVPPPRFTKKRQREDDSPEADLTCDQMLSKYANENSEDDSDYVPNREEGTNDDTTTSVTTHSSSEDTRGEYNMAADKAILNVPTSQEPVKSDNKPENVEIVTESGPQGAPIKPIGSATANVPQPPPAPQQTPVENGPSNGNGNGNSSENRDADVAQKRLLTPSASDRKRTLLNGGNHDEGDGELLRKSTPGHESAARTIPSIPSHFRSVTSATLNDTNDDLPLSYPTNTPPSPSSTTSSSSLASFVTSDEFIVNEHSPDALTPTPFQNYTFLERSNLNDASSSDDVFYSPIGSPGSSANFQPFFSPESILKNPILSSAQVDGHSTPKSTDAPESEPTPSSDKPKTQQHLSQPSKQTHHHNRYRGRNRR